MRLLFKGAYYSRVATIQGWHYVWAVFIFFGKPRDLNNHSTRYIRVRWWQLLDAVSNTRSLSVLLSAMGTTSTTKSSPSASLVTDARKHSHTCVHATFTSCGYYLRAATIWGRCLFKEIRYLSIWCINLQFLRLFVLGCIRGFEQPFFLITQKMDPKGVHHVEWTKAE